MRILKITRQGKLKVVHCEVPELGPHDVLVANTFLGINYIDIQQKKKVIKCEREIPGVEAVGKVENVGEMVQNFQVGDRVGYCTLYGAYCEKRVIDSKCLIKIPDFISDELVAAILFKGIFVHSLLRRVYIVIKGARVLVHDADSDIGQIICQWASFSKTTVIGTVSSDDRAEIALDNGCEYVVNYTDSDCIDNIMEVTEGCGVNAVYDSVGLKTCKISFGVLTFFGIYVLFYETSGPLPSVDLKMLKSRSTFFTAPSVFHYKSSEFELNLSVIEIFEMVKKKYLNPKIAKVYTFDEIEQAHEDLEKKHLNGQLIVKIG